MSQKTKQPPSETPARGNLNSSSGENRTAAQNREIDARELAKYHNRPQTICIVAYYAQWKHLLQALMLDWRALGGTPDDTSEYHLQVLRPLMRDLDVFSSLDHTREERLYRTGEYRFRPQNRMERQYNPVEKRSLGIPLTPKTWFAITFQLMRMDDWHRYIYPDVLHDLYGRCNASIDELVKAEADHPHERFTLTIDLNKGFVKDEAVALYKLPFKPRSRSSRTVPVSA